MVPRPRPARKRLSLATLAAAACSLVLPAAASAVIPAAATLKLPVNVVPAYGGPYSLGTATLRVDYTATHVTANASAPSVRLGPGQVFHVSTCLRTQVTNVHVDSSCAERVIDTREKTAVLTYAMPDVSKTAPRPPVGGLGGAVYLVSVRARHDGTYTEGATSWPAAGVSAAQLALAPVGALVGNKLPTQGLSMSWSTQTGGINTGLRDSFCASEQHEARTPAPDAASTTVLGSAAPAYYEVSEPSGQFAGQPPKGVMILINSGGWFRHGSAGPENNRTVADRWRARGWRTLNTTFRPCSQSFEDIRWVYKRARELWGTTLPYCAQGESSGGHLAIELAAAEPALSCAIVQGGPTNALSLGSQTAWSSAGPQKSGPAWVYNMMTAAFGTDMLFWMSPSYHAIKARVLMGVAEQDPYVPWAQATELRSRMRGRDPNAYVDVVRLPPGPAEWAHAGVSQAAADDFVQREVALVAPLVK